MSFTVIFLLFLFWRIFDFIILFFVPRFIPYLGFFPYKEIFPMYHMPYWISALANFDGAHYLLIASQGYMQYEQAFFPLYPLLIKSLSPIVINNGLLTGLIISNIFFILGIMFLFKLAENWKLKNVNWFLFFLLAFPTSFFFGAIYTEGLFFFLFIASLYFLNKKNYLLTFLFAVFASLTRLIGVLLIIPFIFYFFQEFKIKGLKLRVLVLASPLFGLFTYMTYLWKTVHDPLFFLTSQPIFGAHRSTKLIFLPQVYFRYIKIFLTAAHDFRYFVSVFEFAIFNFVFIILTLDLIRNWKLKTKNYWRLGLNLFSFANLILPTLTGTFSSIPRYVLLSLSFFIFLAEIKNKWLKIIILFFFLIIHILVLGFFAQGYFVG